MELSDRLAEKGLKEQYSGYSDYELKLIVRREGSRSFSREVNATFMA